MSCAIFSYHHTVVILQKHWAQQRIISQYTLKYLSILQSFDKGRALTGARSHSLGPALPKQTGHRRLVSQTETTAVLEEKKGIGQKRFLKEKGKRLKKKKSFSVTF